MKRYVIARLDVPGSPDVPAAVVELTEVDRRTFFRICFHLARNVPPQPRASPRSGGADPVDCAA